jgi:alcohol-forming fatty acyl-CoA reductase
VQAQLTRAKNVLTRTEKVLQIAAAARPAGRVRATLETKRMEVERALEYVELYGLYTECEAIYQVDHLMALWDSLDANDQATFLFDPRAVDWPTTSPRSTCPRSSSTPASRPRPASRAAPTG